MTPTLTPCFEEDGRKCSPLIAKSEQYRGPVAQVVRAPFL